MSTRWTLLFGVLALSIAAGCNKDAPAEMPSGEPTTGGDTPTDSPSTQDDPGDSSTSTDSLPPPPAESPWGKTRAEQCKRAERTGMSGRAASRFNDGIRAAQNGDSAGATASFQSALSEDSRAYPAMYNLGVLADRAGDEAGALDFYRKAIAVQPDYEDAARGIARIHIRRGNPTAAVAAVEPMARQFRTNLELQAVYAEALTEARRFELAWDAARGALKCDERHVPSLIALIKASFAQGRDELGDSILAQAMAINNRNAELRFLQGQRYIDQPGRLRDALAEYEQAVQLQPDFAEARMALGVQLLAGGNYPGALSHFVAAERLIATQPAVHVNLGDAYRATKQWTDSRRSYERALQLRSKLPEAHFGLGLLFMSAASEFPGLDELTALQKSQDEFRTYRSEMGSKFRRNDQSTEYLKDLDRLIERTKRRLERERNAASDGGEG